MSRFGNGETGLKKSKVAAVLLLTLRGTPFIYYGEELGMSNLKMSRRHIVDPLGKKYWPFFQGRDPARTPMQWDSSHNAGFTSGEVWLPVHLNYRKVNVKNESSDPDSLLNFYKKLFL